MADFNRRFGRDESPGTNAGRGGSVAVGERGEQTERDHSTNPPPVVGEGDREVDHKHKAGVTAGDVRGRQRDEFGGFNWGSAFFGWLVAIGIGALLTAILSAAGAAIGLTQATESGARQNAETIGLVGGILLIVVSMIAYYAGGYVAGRMSRFDGARQGFGVWLFGLIVTVAIAAAGWILGDKYNIFEQLNLPRIPVSASDLTLGGVIALAAILLGTLLAAISGGKVGQRYHNKVDRAGFGEKV